MSASLEVQSAWSGVGLDSSPKDTTGSGSPSPSGVTVNRMELLSSSVYYLYYWMLLELMVFTTGSPSEMSMTCAVATTVKTLLLNCVSFLIWVWVLLNSEGQNAATFFEAGLNLQRLVGDDQLGRMLFRALDRGEFVGRGGGLLPGVVVYRGRNALQVRVDRQRCGLRGFEDSHRAVPLELVEEVDGLALQRHSQTLWNAVLEHHSALCVPHEQVLARLSVRLDCNLELAALDDLV